MKPAIACLTVSALLATPANASVREAAFASSADRQSPQMSMFVGASYRIDLDRAGKSAGKASLKFAGMTSSRVEPEFKFGRGLELTSAPGSKPSLLIAGRETREVGRRASLSTGVKVGLVVVGVILVAGAVVALLIDERLDRQNTE